MELIPGLPNDVALECLTRTDYSDFSSMSSVCKSWKEQVRYSEFLLQRKSSGKSQVVVAMAQAVPDPDRIRTGGGSKSYMSPPAYRVTLFEPETGIWSELPPLPGWLDGLPMFCRLAGVGSELVLMGGWDPKSYGVSKSVFVYNFITAGWRRGADMPDPTRSFFGCAADCENRVVYVAGGHDVWKNALRSVLAYDVARDEWTKLGDMAVERDECHAVVHRGKVHVIGGYCTDTQGRFEKSAEVFDPDTTEWSDVIPSFLDVATCHTACNVNGSGLYTCRDGHVAVRGEKEGKWINLVEMAGGVGETAACGVAGWGEKMVVIGTGGRRRSSGYVLDLKSLKWSEISMGDRYSGKIQAWCCLKM